MPLPLNTETTIGGVAVVVKSVPEKSSGPNRGGSSDVPQNAADRAVSAYAAPGGSNNYNSRPRGLRIPDFSGLDKALGILGSAAALYELGKSAYSNVKNLQLDFGVLKKNFLPTVTKPQDNLWDRQNAVGDSDIQRRSVAGDDRVRISTDFTIFENGTENPYFKRLKETSGLLFPYTPNITLTYKANYTNTEGIVHTNFPFQAYKSSQIEDITIQGEFTVQNELEGQYWMAAVHFLRTTTRMFYGQSVPAGFPPIVCTLSGYGAEILPFLPVVVKSFQLDLKDNVQYLTVPSLANAGNPGNNMIPMHSTITVVVSPMYNREQSRREFNLADYSAGRLTGF